VSPAAYDAVFSNGFAQKAASATVREGRRVVPGSYLVVCKKTFMQNSRRPGQQSKISVVTVVDVLHVDRSEPAPYNPAEPNQTLAPAAGVGETFSSVIVSTSFDFEARVRDLLLALGCPDHGTDDRAWRQAGTQYISPTSAGIGKILRLNTITSYNKDGVPFVNANYSPATDADMALLRGTAVPF